MSRNERPMTHTSVRLAAVAAAIAVLSIIAHGQGGKTDLTGKWLFTVETSAGPGTPTITFKQDAEKLTGHYSGQLGEADLAGSVKGQAVVFTFTVDVQGTQLTCTYTGTAEGSDGLKGKMDIAGFASGTFTAKRQ
jgi:hypothetical protein